MKIGICIRAEDFLKDPLRADYAEIAAWDLHKMDDGAFAELVCAVREGRLPVYSANGLVIPEIRLTGPDVDMGLVREYCEKAFERLAHLGIRMLVFGSGRSKNVPEGFSFDRAWEQLYEIGTLFSDVAARHGQTVAVEPLCYADANILNTVDEAADYVRQVGRDNFRVLADFYHFHRNGETFDEIRRHQSGLVHFHIAAPITRKCPQTPNEWAYIRDCFHLLREIGYEGGVSFEGKRPPDSATTNEMLDRFRALSLE